MATNNRITVEGLSNTLNTWHTYATNGTCTLRYNANKVFKVEVYDSQMKPTALYVGSNMVQAVKTYNAQM